MYLYCFLDDYKDDKDNTDSGRLKGCTHKAMILYNWAVDSHRKQ